MTKTTNEMQDDLYKIRHSLAHILAGAVQNLYPGTKLGFGPPVDFGFYYDFLFPQPINEENFPAIEAEMTRIIKEKQAFTFEELPLEKAWAQIDSMGEPYKREYAQELAEKNHLTQLRFYTNGKFIDMCEGPHVDNTKQIPLGCFKIRNTAGAYWRGDSNNTMMTRIYVWAFESKAVLEQKLKEYALALENDHKKLGKELELFVIDEVVGKGLPLWTPNGTVLREEMEKLMKELEFAGDYQRVSTPHISRTELFYQTGHLPYYKDDMFPMMEVKDDETYCLRPMNCPHHHRIYASRPRSYRELPLRLAEYGQVYRYESAGSLSGLLRVRGLCQNDAHIYCREDQVQSEFLSVMELHAQLYKIVGFKDYHMRFSTWDPNDPKGKEKYINDPQGWEKAQNLVRKAMIESGLPFVETPGEAAFYGPKIDFQFKSVTGRVESASTNQLDFGIPPRLNLVYTGVDNKEYHPYVIHRAPAGSHERFISFLIEHFGGAFPSWLAPIQVMIIPISDKHVEYGQKLLTELKKNFVRAKMDLSEHSFNKKIRFNVTQKIPQLLIIGDKEIENSHVSVRYYKNKDNSQVSIPFAQFLDQLLLEIKNRA